MERYYVKRPTGKVFGPFDENAIRLMLKGGKIGTDAQVSTDKQSWQPIAQIAAFGDALGGGGQSDGSEASLPQSANSGPQLPRSKSGGSNLPRSKGAPPDLPTPKSSGPELPTPKSSGPELPTPKSSGPELPTPKSSGPELPTPKSPDNLPRSGQDNLPRSGHDNLPGQAQDNLPRSGQDNLPRSGHDNLPGQAQGNLPRSGQDNLPRSDKDNLPQAAEQLPRSADSPPPPSPPVEDDDLFGSPIEDDDDLFSSPDGLDDDSDDLFSSPDGLDDDSDDLFSSPDGLDDDSDDLFSSPAPEGDDDPFADSDPLEDDDDLFDAPEMEDDDLFSDAPTDDDDFLGGDQGFSFLDEESEETSSDDLEDWEQDISNDTFSPEDLGEQEDDWGDDLLDEDSSSPPASSRPPSRSPQPAADEHDPLRPASSGIKQPDPAAASATTTQDEAVDADQKRGAMTLIGVVGLGLLLFGGGGFGLYQAFFAGDDDGELADEGPRAIELAISDIQADNYETFIRLFEEAGTGELDRVNQGRLLLAKALYLTRYQDEDVADRADALAASLSGHEDEPTVAVALATNEARLAQPDAARAFAEPFADDPEIGYFAHLSMGIADANAHFEDDDFAPLLDIDGDDSDEAAAEFDADEMTDEDVELDEEEATDEEDDEQQLADGEDASDDDEASEEQQRQEAEEQRREIVRLAERAAQHFEAAAGADSSNALPHYWMSRLALHVDQIDQALEHLERAVNADPAHVASRLQAGQIYYEQGHLNDAAEHLREINDALANQASDTESGEALHLMGMVYQARQESEEAIDMFTRALSTDSSRTDSLRALAQEYERAEMYEEALNFFTTDGDLSREDPDVMLGIVRSHMGLEQWSTSIRQLEEGEEQFPEDARFPYNLGVLNEERGHFREAREAYERALEIDPEILPARTSLAQLSWRIDNDVTEGERHIAAIVDRPEQIDAAIAADVAEYYRMSGRASLARNWNEEALRIDPNFWEARLALARLFLDDGQPTEALELLERSRDEGVQALQLSAYLADAYRQDGQFDRAIDEINSVISQDPDDEQYIFIRGLIYFDRGNYTTAREDFSNAYDLDPQFHDAYFYVGRTSLAEGDYTTATRIFRHVLDYQPDNGEIHYFMGRTFEKENSLTRALDSYRNAVTADPEFVADHPDVLVRRGRLYADLGRAELAQADLRRALEMEPENPEALLSIGALNFSNGNYDAAIENYVQALEDDPEHPQAQYELGMSYVYTNQDQDGARHLQLAVRYGYDNPEIYQTMGYLYRELGQRSDAVESFKTFLRESDMEQMADSTRREMLRQIQDLGG